MEIVLSIICIVLLVVVIYLLYTTQMKLNEKMAETQANSSSLDRQYNSIISMLTDIRSQFPLTRNSRRM